MSASLRKSWITLYKELVAKKSCGGMKKWLKQESLVISRRLKVPQSIAESMIKANIIYLSQHYGLRKEKRKIESLFGL